MGTNATSEPVVLMDGQGAPTHPAATLDQNTPDELVRRADYWRAQESRLRTRATIFEEPAAPLDQMLAELVGAGAAEVELLAGAHGRVWGIGAIGKGERVREAIKSVLVQLLDHKAARQFEIIALNAPEGTLHFEVALGDSWVKAGVLQLDEKTARAVVGSNKIPFDEKERLFAGVSDVDHVDLFIIALPDLSLRYQTEVGADLSRVPGASPRGRLIRTSGVEGYQVRVTGAPARDGSLMFVEQLDAITTLRSDDPARLAAIPALTGAMSPRWIQWDPSRADETTVLTYVVGTETWETDEMAAIIDAHMATILDQLWRDHPEVKARLDAEKVKP